MRSVCAILIFLVASSNAWSADGAPRFSSEDIQFFEKKIRPLLSQHCYRCHSTKAKRVRGGLRLDSRAALLKGGDSGSALVAKNPEQSRLIKAVHYGDVNLQMPPKGKLDSRAIRLLEEWIRRGAPFPDSAGQPNSGLASKDKDGIDIAKGRNFWSFRPLKTATLAKTQNQKWVRNRIDAFILAKLEKHNLTPSAPAARRTLIRRATFDLIGLPPTPEEVEAFVNDKAPNAYEKLIDRLLDSPHYGERWARYWLDLVRYADIAEPWAETKGQAWLYRDWVVQAFNRDMPYNQFVIKQFAADLMPQAQPEDMAALGFLGRSPSYWKELKLDHNVIKTVVAEEWEERIEAGSRTFLGLTVACARCHDHKFDPITTEDYYALAGVLASTKLVDRALLPDAEAERVQKARAQVKSLQQQIAKLRKQKAVDAKERIAKLQQQIATIKKSTPHFDAPMAPAVTDASLFVMPDGPNQTKLVYKKGEARNIAVQIRGSPTNLGPVVRRRFLSVLSDGKPRTFSHGSGRLELAQAIVTDAAPLTARVIVNRIWQHHFGRGLVRTPSDFGAQGDRPSHPKLLDDLAARFIQKGWSLKWLHREIMLSATYRQSSKSGTQNTKGGKIDPDNRLLWRMNRRRLEVEAWRDAMLAATGALDPKIGGPPLDLNDAKNRRRTLYGIVKRRELSDLLRLHDFPDPVAHSARRVPTTTPLQQLFTLNSPFMQQQATALVQRLQREIPASTEAKVRRAYLLLYGRPPTEHQLRLGMEFLTNGHRDGPISDAAWKQYAQVLLGSNEFLFVD